MDGTAEKRTVRHGRGYMAAVWIDGRVFNQFGWTAAEAERKRDADVRRALAAREPR